MDQGAATMLHKKACPYGYQCQALDCMECMEIYEHEENNPSGPAGHLPLHKGGFGLAEDGKVDGLETGSADKVNTVPSGD